MTTGRVGLDAGRRGALLRGSERGPRGGARGGSVTSTARCVLMSFGWWVGWVGGCLDPSTEKTNTTPKKQGSRASTVGSMPPLPPPRPTTTWPHNSNCSSSRRGGRPTGQARRTGSGALRRGVTYARVWCRLSSISGHAPPPHHHALKPKPIPPNNNTGSTASGSKGTRCHPVLRLTTSC